MSDSTILVADIGGTNARFAIADAVAAMPLVRDSIREFRVADFPDCVAAARQYLEDVDATISHAAFSVAGPVANGCVKFTNSSWIIDSKSVGKSLGLDSLRLVNDFAAMSFGVSLLADSDVRAIGGPARTRFGAEDDQTFAVAGAGTGLGVGALLLRGKDVQVLQTEGGHMGFAPRDDEQVEILRILSARFGHVSNERLLSGGGLVNLYEALAGIAGVAPERLEPEDVTSRAESDGQPDRLCVRAIEIFCDVLGAVAGDLVLAFGAWDGVYLAGGLTPLLLPWIERGHLRVCFEAKGRFASRMREVPLSAVLDTDAGLLGAAAYAVIAAGGSLIDSAQR
ncbi:MAG: glucokinase [Rhodanobacteraceae bacterium]